MRTALLLLLASTAVAEEPSPSPVLQSAVVQSDPRVPDLEARIARLEAAQKQAEARAAETPIISFGPNGMVLRTPDGKSTIQLRGLLQADGRAFLDNQTPGVVDTFLLRRARPSVDASFFGWLEARLMPDFGLNKVLIEDAWVDLKPWKWLGLIGGKFKPPVGLERLQTDAFTKFMERAFPTNLVPSRDVGAMLHGLILDGTIDYAVGIFNGVVDGADTPDIDAHDGKDYAARLFFHPLRLLKKNWLNNLGVGVSGTFGEERGNASQPNVPTYKTPGQNVFFSYFAATGTPGGFTFANGDQWRVSPQLYYYGGPIGLMAEYARSSQEVQRGTMTGTVWSDAWQIQLSALLTPHDRESYDRIVISEPLEAKRHGYGAFELVARYHEQHISSAAFPTFADPAKSARQARAFGIGLNWWANRFFRAAINYDRTDFVGGAPKGGDREPENALMGRLQAVF
jgi:phosphate-selective porin OprO/OprP